MKKVIVAAMVLVFLVLSGGASFAFQNEPDSFRGLLWGDPPTEEMKWDRTNEYGESLYTLPGEKENLFLGDTEIWSISYFFYGEPNRFGAVRLFFQEALDYLSLRTTCGAC